MPTESSIVRCPIFFRVDLAKSWNPAQFGTSVLGRHNKHEKNEKIEKKKHKQKLQREEKELQKLVARQKLKSAAKNSDRAGEQGRSLLPVLEEATHIQVEDTVPVSVFGRQLPDMESSCFSLSWM